MFIHAELVYRTAHLEILVVSAAENTATVVPTNGHVAVMSGPSLSTAVANCADQTARDRRTGQEFWQGEVWPDPIVRHHYGWEISARSSSIAYGGSRRCNIAWQLGQTGTRSFVGSTK